MIARLLLGSLAIVLSSCGIQTLETGRAPQALPDFSHQQYQPPTGAVTYQVDTEQTRVDILVYRGGPLARFGHDHVVSAKPSDGVLFLTSGDFKSSRGELRFELASLTVDDPQRRDQFQLETELTPQDIEGTAANMHGHVLQTAGWPQAHVTVEITGGTLSAPEARLTLYLHGVEQTFPITLSAEGLGEDRLQVWGKCRLRQSDYGIAPFSVLGGGLQLLDELDVSFTLHAVRLDPTAVTLAAGKYRRPVTLKPQTAVLPHQFAHGRLRGS